MLSTRDQARFTIYRNNVLSGLLRSLEETFPVSTRIVGEQFFRAMAAEFVRQKPPTSPRLGLYGEAFPDFVEVFPLASKLTYLADVARLEWVSRIAYDAADMAHLTVDALSALEPPALATTRLTLHPSTGLLHSCYPIVSLWRANQPEENGVLSVPLDTAENALVVRLGSDINLHRIGPLSARYLDLVTQGLTIEAAAETVSRETRVDLGHMLVQLIEIGAFAANQQKISP